MGLRNLAARHGALVFADVADCYATISPAVVRGCLERLGVPDARAAAHLLRGLAEAGIPGLPVGPAPSALFANGVLSHVDRTLEAAGIDHLRWVDDVVMGVRGPSDAPSALELFARALGELGLRPNHGKTRVIVDPSSVTLTPSGLRKRTHRLG
jgi:hypothetical protein